MFIGIMLFDDCLFRAGTIVVHLRQMGTVACCREKELIQNKKLPISCWVPNWQSGFVERSRRCLVDNQS